MLFWRILLALSRKWQQFRSKHNKFFKNGLKVTDIPLLIKSEDGKEREFVIVYKEDGILIRSSEERPFIFLGYTEARRDRDNKYLVINVYDEDIPYDVKKESMEDWLDLGEEY